MTNNNNNYPDFIKDLLEVTSQLNERYNNEVKKTKIEKLVNEHPELANAPKEWLNAFVDQMLNSKIELFEEPDFIEGVIFLKIIFYPAFVDKNIVKLEELYTIVSAVRKRDEFTKIGEMMLDFDLTPDEALKFYKIYKTLKGRN
jgi:hypothetical protein